MRGQPSIVLEIDRPRELFLEEVDWSSNPNSADTNEVPHA